jgi:hypothetical protein
MPETPEKSFAEAVLNTTTRGGVSQDRRPEKGFAGERQHTAQSFSLHVDFRDGRAGEGVAWSHFARYRWRDAGEHESLRIIFGPTCAMEILGHNLGSLVNLVRDGKLNGLREMTSAETTIALHEGSANPVILSVTTYPDFDQFFEAIIEEAKEEKKEHDTGFAGKVRGR